MSKLLVRTWASAVVAGLVAPHVVGASEQVAGYMGIGVESLHPALVTHLPETLLDGQGVMIAHVAKNSPAAAAGLKTHDILVTYDQQKLFAPEQLVKLVHATKPGHKAKVVVVHNGKIEAHTVVLGKPPTASDQATHQHWWQRFPRVPWRVPNLRKEHSSAPWKSFDSLTLKKLDDDRFKAEIEYLDKDGKKQHQVFEGTREDIREQIAAKKDLPANEKRHLERGLDLTPRRIPDDLWPLYDPWRRWENWDPLNEFDF